MNNNTFENIEWNMGSRRMVRITLTAKHTVTDPGNRRGVVSLFQELKKDRHPLNADGHADPEDYPEEMNDAVQDMLDRDAGFTEGEIYDNGADAYEDDLSDDDAPMSLEEIWDKMQEIGQKLGVQDDDDDLYVFRTLGSMERKTAEDGHEVIEISYTEDDSMDDTTTVILYDPVKPNSVTIYHTGGVMSTLICEKGVRHISAYQTQLMPFEVAVYTKKCDGGFTFEEGGSLELDYMVEIRGADMQRTTMTIDAVAL